MDKRLTLLCFVAVLLFSDKTAIASLRLTVESVAVGNIKTALRYYEEQHGNAATNWAQIDEIIQMDIINRNLEGSPTYPLQEHYVFITNKISIPGYEQGDVVLIRTSPVKNDAGNGRYVIARNSQGLHYMWLSESKVQNILIQAITSLPASTPPEVRLALEQLRAHTDDHRFKPSSIALAVLAILGAGGLTFLFLRKRKPSDGSAQ